MNIASDEVIRSLFFNKHNQNLITVSVYSGDNYTSLRCRTTPLECVLYLSRLQPLAGYIEVFATCTSPFWIITLALTIQSV